MQVRCSFEFCQQSDSETIGAIVSDGRITTDILVCRALHRPRIRDICRGRSSKRLHPVGSHRGGGYTVPCRQAQEAFGSFLSETSLSRRLAIRAATGAAGGGCEPGSFDPGGLPRRFGATSAIQLGGLPGPLARPRKSRSRLRIDSSICSPSAFSSARIFATSIPFGSSDLI